MGTCVTPCGGFSEAEIGESEAFDLNLTNDVSLYALPAHGKERMMKV